MKEIWKDVTWYEWKYKVSDLWRVKSFICHKKWKILRIQWNWYVYFNSTSYSVMRLVAKEHLWYCYGDKRLHLKCYTKIDWKRYIWTDNITTYKNRARVKTLVRYRDDLQEVCNKHHLLLEQEVLSNRRDKYIQKWRAECYIVLYRKAVKLETIWEIFNKNHAAVIYTLNKHHSEEYKQLVAKYK